MPRPKGSKNKRTLGVPADLAAELGNRDPAEVLASVYAMPLEQLKRLVRSKAGAAAMGMRLRAAEAAMPYVHSKMPIKMTVEDDRLPTLVIVQGGDQKMLQIQRLIDAAAVRRDGGEAVEHERPSDTKDIGDENR